MWDANRRSTLIYHDSFKGAAAHGDKHKIGEPVGSRATDTIKAHEMQMDLYVRFGRLKGGGLVVCYAHCHLLAIKASGRTSWWVICSFNNFHPHQRREKNLV